MKKITAVFLGAVLGCCTTVGLFGCAQGPGKDNNKNDTLTYYFDSVSGSDSADGRSETSAFKSLSPLYSLEVTPGTVLAFKGEFQGNISFSGSGTKENPIVLKSYGEKRALIDGTDRMNCLFLQNQSHIVIDNLEFTLNEEDSAKRNGIYITADKGIVGDITIRNCYIHDVTGTWIKPDYYDSAGINIRYLADASLENKFENILIENTRIERVVGLGMRIGDSAEGIGEDAVHPYFGNIVVRNVTIDSTSNDGIILQDCYKPVVEYSKILRVGTLFPDPGRADYYHCAVWSCATESPLYQFNEVAYTTYVSGDGQAFDTDWGSRGTAVWQYNYTHDNEGGVLLRHENFNGIFKNNVSVNDGCERVGRGLIFHSFIDVGEGVFEAMNNIFYNDAHDLQISFGFTDPSCTAWEKKDSSLDRFYDNVFVFPNQDVEWGSSMIYSGNAYFCLNGTTQAPVQDESSYVGNPFRQIESLPADIMSVASCFVFNDEAQGKTFGVEDLSAFVIAQSGANF